MENAKNLLLQCHERILPHVHRTPVLTSRLINALAKTDVFFKCENFQRGGSFKIRGATNAILQRADKERNKGVVTHSSGNFAQALSLAARGLGVEAFIVMPATAPQVKKDAVQEYGGKIIECEPTPAARNAAAKKLEIETGATFIHPSNDKNVILGQGTACIELLEEHPDLNFVITPVGGGGLIAGTSLAAYYFGDDCKIIGGEPFQVDDAYRAMRSGKIESNTTTNTIADGLKTQLGDMNFPIIQQYVDGIVRVTENEIIEAMRIIWERMKIIVEPSSAVALAVVLTDTERFKNKKIGIIISGGNVDLNILPF